MSPKPAAGRSGREAPKPRLGGAGPAHPACMHEPSRCCHHRVSLAVAAATVTTRDLQHPRPTHPAPMAFLTTWKRAASRKRDHRYRTARKGTLRGPRMGWEGNSEGARWKQRVTELGSNCSPRATQRLLLPHVLPAVPEPVGAPFHLIGAASVTGPALRACRIDREIPIPSPSGGKRAPEYPRSYPAGMSLLSLGVTSPISG